MKKNALVIVLGLLAVSPVATAAVFPGGAGGVIPDANAAGFSSAINVADFGPITSVNCVTISGFTHTWVGDLVATLSHGGQDVQLFRRVGATDAGSFGDPSNLNGDYAFCDLGADFAAAAALAPDAGVIPGGTYLQTGASLQVTPPLDPDTFAVFDGLDVNGAWTLNVADRAGFDLGSFREWSLDVNFAQVPEPATLALLGLAFAGLGFARRRTQH